MSQSISGTFEHQVLLALLRLGGRAYSAEVVLELEERTGREVSPAAVYIALRRLVERDLLTSVKRDPEPGEGGRGRRTFAVEPGAVEALRETRQAFESLWDGLDPVFDER